MSLRAVPANPIARGDSGPSASSGCRHEHQENVRPVPHRHTLAIPLRCQVTKEGTIPVISYKRLMVASFALMIGLAGCASGGGGGARAVGG